MKTSYSRRELYALGEPLGDSATYYKADGGYVLGDGGGGGGSAPANTTSTSTQTAELPEWARGYAKDTLAKGAALTDINQNPYQQYTGDRIAGFSPMQQQAMQNAQGMTVAPQIGQGTALAGNAGIGGLNVAGQANAAGFQNQVGGYMNPYINQILAPQLAEANRQYDVSGARQQASATGAGAFGGSREAIMAAENERNRNMGLQSITGQGYNTAFTNAQNQYNQNLQNQLAGYNLMGSAAGQLGQLGQNQYGQQMGINQLQAQYGGQQQALQQQGLTQAYQDFQNQQNYPYKQLGFMSDMIRGLPLGQQSTKSVYEPPGSISGQIGGLGMGALGLAQLGKFATAAEGGLMDSYADGGEVQGYAGGGSSYVGNKLNDPNYLQDLVHRYPATPEGEQALLEAMQRAQSQGNDALVEAIQSELGFRKSMRSGVASAITPQIAQDLEPVAAANGGIVAFADGDLITDPQFGGSTSTYEPPKKLPMSEVQKIVSDLKDQGKTVGLSDVQDIMYGKYVVDKPKTSLSSAISDPYNAATPTRRSDEKPVSVKPGPEVFKGLADISKSTGISMDSIVNQWKTLSSSINAENAEDLTQLNTLANKLSGRSNQIKQEGLGRALAEFGFKWAQSASRPGSRFLSSAAEASPAISTSLAKTQEAMQLAEDNQQRIEIAMQQAKIASKQGNRALAAQLTQHANMLALQNKQIEQAGVLGRAQIASIDKYRDTMANVQANRSKAAIIAAEAKVIPLFQNDRGAKDLAKQLESKYGKNWQQQSDPQIQYQNYFNKFKAMHLPSLVESGGGIPYSDAY